MSGELVAPCSSSPRLFDSIDLRDHYEARELCIHCSRSTSCPLIALGDRDASGTYGGLLIRQGRVLVAIK